MEIDISKEKGLKVLFLHLSNAPISYYRMIQYANHMAQFEDIMPFYPKFEPEVHDLYMREYELYPEKNLAYLNRLFEIADVIVCSAIHSTKFLCTLKALKDFHKKVVIMESDDSPFHIDSQNPNHNVVGIGSEIERNSYDQAKFSDAVILSTDYLRHTILDYNENVHLVPNTLDLDDWENFNENQWLAGRINLGWSGAAGHNRDLSLVKKVFHTLLDKYPNLYIKCLHGGLDLIEHERFTNIFEWSPIDAYPEKLYNLMLDIAVAPLWDSEFNRCKSNLRYLEYSALKIPTVASRVEPYSKTITDGVDGFLASDTTEWVDKISQLCDSINLRDKMGKLAYEKVKAEYNSKKVAREYADLLKTIHKEKIHDVNVQRDPRLSDELLRGGGSGIPGRTEEVNQ